MSQSNNALPTGRVGRGPADVLVSSVLRHQFEWEMRNLLPYYVWIEFAQLDEYRRMGILSSVETTELAAVLARVSPDDLRAGGDAWMSDPLFSLECHVIGASSVPVVAWHVDRSRNDVQACAQLMWGRQRLLDIAVATAELARVARRQARAHIHSLMPGYTHHQAAQGMTLGFFLAALAESVTRHVEAMCRLWPSVNLSPLGAGALAGLELGWDRDRLARSLGLPGRSHMH